MDHRHGKGDGTASNSRDPYCSKETFIETVLIMADFCCAANPQHTHEYAGLCNRLAEHLATVLNISMQPHHCFEDFRTVNKKPSYILTRKFVETMKALQQYPALTEKIRSITVQGRFSTIAMHIEEKQEAERITSLLLPYIQRL